VKLLVLFFVFGFWCSCFHPQQNKKDLYKVSIVRLESAYHGIPLSRSAFPIVGLKNKLFANSGDAIVGLDIKELKDDPIVWVKKIPNINIDSKITGHICVQKDFLVFAEQNGMIHKWDRINKKPAWAKPANVLEPVISAPLVHADYVFIKTIKNMFYCLDLYTGKRLWSYEMKAASSGINLDTQVSPIILDLQIVTSDAEGSIYALDIKTGKLIWKKAYAGRKTDSIREVVGLSDPYDDMMFATYFSGSVLALKIPKEGESPIVNWSFDLPNDSFVSSYFIDNGIYLSTLSGYVYKLAASDGRVIWKKHIGTSADYLVSYQDKLYILTSNGQLIVVSRESGEELFKKYFAARLLPPVFKDKWILLPTATGSVYVLK
jgi:outer membrane protein assembly factor BamB